VSGLLETLTGPEEILAMAKKTFASIATMQRLSKS